MVADPWTRLSNFLGNILSILKKLANFKQLLTTNIFASFCKPLTYTNLCLSICQEQVYLRTVTVHKYNLNV